MGFREDVQAARPSLFWLPGERTGTTTYDLSGNGRNGTYTGTLTRGAPSPYGGVPAGAVMDGSTGYLQRAYDAAFDVGTGDFAVMVIANVSGSSTVVHPLFHRDTGSTGSGIIINLQDTGTAWTFWCAGSRTFGSSPNLTAAPHMFVSTRRSGVLYAYADANQLGTASATGSVQTGGRIQSGHDDNPDFAKGGIYAVAFWHTRGLAPTEVRVLYNSARVLMGRDHRRRLR